MPPFRFPALLRALLPLTMIGSWPADAQVSLPPLVAETAPKAAGVVRLRSELGVEETARRIRTAAEAKGIRYFTAIDQSELATGDAPAIGKSILVLFGNPPLGLQFLEANPYAGLDWPVRMLVSEDADGKVWIAWSDFAFIGERYGLNGLDAQLAMAAQVAATIASEASRPPSP